MADVIPSTTALDTTMQDTITDPLPQEEQDRLLSQQAAAADESETEEDEIPLSPIDETPLLQPCASRLISCLRAPCLKRTSIIPSSSPLDGSRSASGTTSPDLGNSSPPELTLSAYSFASIRKVLAVQPKRQVHFDEAPPEAGVTYSRDNYDRRPIECTRGGSSSDLSLPPRGMCPRYSGEADDEACAEAEDDVDEDGRKERTRGFARWARSKNGGTILGSATLRYPAKSTSSDSYSLTGGEPVDDATSSNTCSVPVHGIRSFGGLAGSKSHAAENHSPDRTANSHASDMARDTPLERHRSLLHDIDDDDEDIEHGAFREAVCRALQMSPNATPMPSPSVRTRWECVASIVEKSIEVQVSSELTETSSSEAPEQEPRSSSVGSSLEPSTTKAEEKNCESSTENEAADSAASTLRPPTSSSVPTLSQAKLLPTPSSIESSAHTSSSPMSSRCSSTDTWSSHEVVKEDRKRESDEFELAFSKNLATLRVHGNGQDESGSRPEVSSPSEAADSLEDQAGISSCSTLSGSNEWMSSCGTSPDLTPSEDICRFLGADDESTLGAESREEPKSAPAEVGKQGNRFAYETHVASAFPMHFLVPSRRAVSHSAPGSTSHSPCVMSADEDEGEAEEGRTAGKKCSVAALLQRSSSCSRKGRKSKRATGGIAVGEGAADSDDGITATRPRRSGAGLRSKSMSSALCSSAIKKSSFSASSFRSEIDDDGALGGF